MLVGAGKPSGNYDYLDQLRKQTESIAGYERAPSTIATSSPVNSLSQSTPVVNRLNADDGKRRSYSL